MDYLPIFCDLKGKACLLVGGGEIAERKARLLLDAGATITVNATKFSDAFIYWQQQGQLTLYPASFAAHLLDNKWLVIAATNDPTLNRQISHLADAKQLFCNVVDDPQRASFIMPSIIDRSPVIVAVSSGGTAPVLARLLREKLEAMLPQHLGKLAQYASQLRCRVKAKWMAVGLRRRFWEKLLTHDRLAQALVNSDKSRIESLTQQLLDEPLEARGEVVLVGAGPGDAGLLTLSGLQQIQQADTIVYDRLVSSAILKLVRRDAEMIFVGKRAGAHCVPQAEINQILLTEAQRGKRVVRLKGGDPFIFGRGGEELEALYQANIPFSVVPGITSASGCSAYSGIPLTHREHAQSIRLVTGHLQTGSELDWSNLAAEKQTLVFYMGLTQAEHIAKNLMQYGMAAVTRVAIIEQGTTPQQKVYTGTLAALGILAQQAASPALIIIGSVVSLRDKLKWFSESD